MYLEHETNLAEMQRLNQKIETLDENLKLTAKEVKAKSEGEYTINQQVKTLQRSKATFFSLIKVWCHQHSIKSCDHWSLTFKNFPGH